MLQVGMHSYQPLNTLPADISEESVLPTLPVPQKYRKSSICFVFRGLLIHWLRPSVLLVLHRYTDFHRALDLSVLFQYSSIIYLLAPTFIVLAPMSTSIELFATVPMLNPPQYIVLPMQFFNLMLPTLQEHYTRTNVGIQAMSEKFIPMIATSLCLQRYTDFS